MPQPDEHDLNAGTDWALEIGHIPVERRMLLLPHCLRPSEGCPGRMTKHGLECEGCHHPTCKIRAILDAAIKAGYKHICIAPGGRLAVRYVDEVRPAVIIAVACDKELKEGVEAVQTLGWNGSSPPILQIPLVRDGCVDTDVDVPLVVAAIEK